MADQVLFQGVDGITSLITTPGLINLDFADVKSVMTGAGSALMGIGHRLRRRPGRGGGEGRHLAPAAGVLDRRRQGRAALDRRPHRPLAARGQRGRRRASPGWRTPTPTSSSAPSSTTRSARRSGSRSWPPASTRSRRIRVGGQPASRAGCPGCSRSPSAAGTTKASPAVDPRRRRRRGHGRVHDSERSGAGVGVVRRRGGPGHPGLPEELTDTTSVPARPRAVGAGRFRARRRPSPASWPRASPPPPVPCPRCLRFVVR